MKLICLLLAILVVVLALPCVAQSPQSFEEAKQLSIEQNKPLLLEFFREE